MSIHKQLTTALLVYVLCVVSACRKDQVGAPDDEKATSAVVAREEGLQDIALLKDLRDPSVPRSISPNTPAYEAIMRLSRARGDREQVFKELINWIAVQEPRPKTTEKINKLRLYPAARALIALGDETVPSLVDGLRSSKSKQHAVLVVECLRAIKGEKQYRSFLRTLRAEAGSKTLFSELALDAIDEVVGK